MNMASLEQLQLEVRELTDLLRTDDAFADLREVLTAKGLSPSDTILAGLLDGEDESSYGVIITSDGECIRFETAPDSSLMTWDVIQDLDTLADDFRAPSVAMAMKRDGTIS
jgi:hypothetical protein